MLRESKQINEDIMGMFGDDPDPTVTTARVGSVEVSDMHSRVVDALCKEGFRGLAVGSGLCRWSREEREGKPGNSFWRLKTYDVLTDYIVAIVNRLGVKQSPNAMKLGRRPTYNITTPHANFQPIPRTFSGHL